ncbi:TetR/AcrR family transcriptional regulator [Nocardia sp. IFM 10818]
MAPPFGVTYAGPLDATAERILDAALTCFGRNGIRRTPMDAVAAEAGLARSSVYRYFRQKSDLISAVLTRELHRFLTELESATATIADPATAAAEGFVTTVRFIRASPILSELLLSDSEELLPFLTVRGGSLVTIARTYLVQRLTAASPAGGSAPEAREQLAETAVRLAMSFVFNRESVIDLDDDAALRRYAHRFIAPLAALAFTGDAGT